jgi:hypothetical protein
MDRQVYTGDTVLAKSREMTSLQEPNTAMVTGGRRDKEHRNQNTLAQLGEKIKHEGGVTQTLSYQ